MHRICYWRRENIDFTGTIINEYNSLPSFWWMWLIVVAVVRLDELSHQLFAVDELVRIKVEMLRRYSHGGGWKEEVGVNSL